MTSPLTAVLALAFLTACSPTPQSGPSTPAAAAFPPYFGPDTQLFDDTLSPELFGAPDDGSGLLEQRARSAEGIAPARVQTVTRDTRGETEGYLIDVLPAGPALKGPTPSSALSLTIPPGNPSFALVRSVDSSLVGTRLLLFYKRYGQDGQVVLHFRAEADSPRVQQVVNNARLMSELGR